MKPLRRAYSRDAAQQALGFMINQASYIEAQVYRIQYPEIQYPFLVPIDESAPDWVKSITFFSISQVGQAEWFHAGATDMRLADISRDKQEVGVEMAGIGYRYNIEEIQQAIQMGINLTVERASSATRAYNEFVEKIVLTGDTSKNWAGMLNDSGVSAATVVTGVGGVTWALKTGDEIALDINTILTGIYTTSNTVEMADTLLLPVAQFTALATKRLGANMDISVLEWIQKYNVYTAQTGLPLTIRAVRQLKDIGGAGVDRMVAYRRDPAVIRIHIPMRHHFLPVWQTGPLVFDVPGIFRLGGIEIRRPTAIRYANGI